MSRGAESSNHNKVTALVGEKPERTSHSLDRRVEHHFLARQKVGGKAQRGADVFPRQATIRIHQDGFRRHPATCLVASSLQVVTVRLN
jgi:hypothetical protein